MPISIAGSGAVTGASTLNGLTVPTDAIAPGMVHLLTRQIDTVAGQVVQLTNLFSANYDCYRIISTVKVKSTNANVYYYRAQLLQGTTASNTGYAYTVAFRNTSSNTYNYYSDTAINLAVIEETDYCLYITDIVDPFLAKQTKAMMFGSRGGIQEYMSTWHNQAVSYNGLSLSSSSTTGEIGTLYVYGYRK